MSTSGSMAARSLGSYISFMRRLYCPEAVGVGLRAGVARVGAASRRATAAVGLLEGPWRLRRPVPVHRQACAVDGASTGRLAGGEDKDAIELRGLAGFVAPDLGHLATGGHVVQGDTRQAVALRSGRELPYRFGQADAARRRPAAIHFHVADDEGYHGIVRKCGAQTAQHFSHEDEIGISVMGVVQKLVYGRGVVAQEPESEPIVVAVLHDAQIWRRRDNEAGLFRQAARAQGLSESDPRIAGVAEKGDAAGRRNRLAVEASEFVVKEGKDIALWGVEVSPFHKIPDVARGHAECVGHDGREVATALAVENAGEGCQDEAISSLVRIEAGAQE